MTVDGTPTIIKPLSTFKGYPNAATRPDILYLGSLALLENPTRWSDIELDWIRVYAPVTTPQAIFGLTEAIIEASPTPTDTATIYSNALPAGPFTNTPHWNEDFDGISLMPNYWIQVHNFDLVNTWMIVDNSYAKILSNGNAESIPVWAIFDDMLPLTILSEPEEGWESPADYLRRRGGSPFIPNTQEIDDAAIYPRHDWRPDGGNIRYAWRGFQSANGYGVEISNGGHGDWGDTVYFIYRRNVLHPARHHYQRWRAIHLSQLPGAILLATASAAAIFHPGYLDHGDGRLHQRHRPPLR